MKRSTHGRIGCRTRCAGPGLREPTTRGLMAGGTRPGLVLLWILCLGLAGHWTGPGSDGALAARLTEDGARPGTAARWTGRERLDVARRIQEEIREGMSGLQERMDQARRNRDVETLSCLNEQHARLRALLEVVTTATVLLQEAVERGEGEGEQAAVQFQRVVLAREYARRILRDADACKETGEAVLQTEEASTTVLESPLEPEGPIPGPIETLLDPDLAAIPCW